MQGGHAMLKSIQRMGIDYIFSSPGSEWPPIWEALAQQTAQGLTKPGFINCRHEALAVAMAAGYTKATGKPQVVLLHATAGPLNAAMLLRAAFHERTPMVICSGEVAAYGENTQVADPGGQWLHDLTDLNGSPGLLRQCVKWSDRISSSALLVSTLERGIHIALEPPKGPVLIGVPFECMMEEVELSELTRANEVARPMVVDDGTIDKALSLIAAAKNPVVVTEHLGSNARAVENLVQLCELFSIPVMESRRPAFVNFPRTHPLRLRYDRKFVESSDLVLMIEAVTPWYPASKGPKGNSKVISIAEEFPNSRLPFWGYNVDLALAAPPAFTLERMVERARGLHRSDADQAVAQERLAQTRAQHERERAKFKEDAEKHASDVPIDPRWLCHALGQAIPEEAIITEETTVYRGLIHDAIPRSQPMSYFARATGGLGVGLGYALGVKLAMRERPVFALIGDGAFNYNPVPACLGVAEEYQLPVNIVVFNNGRYFSMELSLLGYFPDGAAKKTGLHYGGPISPRPDYQMYAKAHGGYGVRVTEPQEIQAAIEQAVRANAEGKLSLIDVVLNDFNPR
jgi:acetolactate synthase-1/2/3 large subunit